MKLRNMLMPSFFIICIGVAAYIVARVQPVVAPRGFTLHITQTAYPKDRSPILTATKVRYQKSDGNWKNETTYSDGRLDVGFGQVGVGVVRVDDKNQKLEYVSEMSEVRQNSTEDYWRKNPGFVGEETILGLKTFHIHWENNGEYSDFYMCPALQGYPLRSVSGNARSKTIFEVTQVILGEPSFGGPPAYQTDMTHYQEAHGSN
ncbi:MAG: hypothetical protein QOH71_588 [Blastocatellia bacterium]|jgi:hypothetical protein|nr:hypothetical protein [Blastocatellia bacterium]